MIHEVVPFHNGRMRRKKGRKKGRKNGDVDWFCSVWCLVDRGVDNAIWICCFNFGIVFVIMFVCSSAPPFISTPPPLSLHINLLRLFHLFFSPGTQFSQSVRDTQFSTTDVLTFKIFRFCFAFTMDEKIQVYSLLRANRANDTLEPGTNDVFYR